MKKVKTAIDYFLEALEENLEREAREQALNPNEVSDYTREHVAKDLVNEIWDKFMRYKE